MVTNRLFNLVLNICFNSPYKTPLHRKGETYNLYGKLPTFNYLSIPGYKFYQNKLYTKYCKDLHINIT